MKKIFSLILALTMFSTVTVSAQSVIITGKTDSGVCAVTVLVTQKGKTIDQNTLVPFANDYVIEFK